MKHWQALTILAMLAVAAGLAGCKPGGSAGNPIKIGEYASLSGKEATFGISSHQGTLLAIEDLNAADGVLGRKLELITEDDLSQAGEPATVVNKLISRDNVVAVLGEVASSRSLEAAPICQQAHIPMISPSSTNPRVTEVGDYIFRVCFIDPFQGTVMADFAYNTLKARKVAVFTDDESDYSKGLAKYFKESFTKLGGQICAELDFNGGDKDFKAQLTAIQASNPDAVFIPGYYTDVALICIQARQLGITVPLIGGDGWESDELVKIGGAAVEGSYFSTHYAPDLDTPPSKKFVAEYQKRFDGQTPDAMAALGYDSAMILADAIKRAGTTAEPQLRDAIAATKNYDGVTGVTTINAERNATKPAVILEVVNGQFKYVKTINP